MLLEYAGVSTAASEVSWRPLSIRSNRTSRPAAVAGNPGKEEVEANISYEVRIGTRALANMTLVMAYEESRTTPKLRTLSLAGFQNQLQATFQRYGAEYSDGLGKPVTPAFVAQQSANIVARWSAR